MSLSQWSLLHLSQAMEQVCLVSPGVIISKMFPNVPASGWFDDNPLGPPWCLARPLRPQELLLQMLQPESETEPFGPEHLCSLKGAHLPQASLSTDQALGDKSQLSPDSLQDQSKHNQLLHSEETQGQGL